MAKFDFIQPIKDIPKTLKGFPKNFIHAWKDPVKNVAEVDERKKEVFSLLYFFIAATLVFTALGFIPVVGGILSLVSFVAIIGIFACLFLFFVLSRGKKKFQMLTCNNCNTMAQVDSKEIFDELVSYELVKEDVSFSVGNDSSDKNGQVRVYAEATAYATYIIKLKCPNCGTVKTLQYNTKSFECRKSENTTVHEVSFVKSQLEPKVREVVKMYQSENRSEIPYTIHSKYHPDYVNRDKFKLRENPSINGVYITFRKDVDEIVEAYFIDNLLNGTIKEVKE